MTSINLNSSVLKKYKNQNNKNEKNSDYENIINYRLHNDLKAFNNLYRKYEKYIYRYSGNVYNRLKPYGNYLSQDDFFQILVMNCFLAIVNQIKIDRTQKNFSLKIFLSQNLRLFSRFYIKKYSKIKEYNYDFDNKYLTSDEILNNHTNYFVAKQVSSERWKHRFSYDPTDTYIYHIDNIKEKIRKKLNDRENQFFQQMIDGCTFKEISNYMNIQMGSVGNFKKQLQNKIKNIISEENK